MSDFFKSIIEKKNQTVDTKIVFVDIVSYSKRRSQAQAMVINSFINCLSKALESTAKHHYAYAEANGVSFQRDVITLPTGDGAAVCFPFEGLHDVHLYFAKALLREVHAVRSQSQCSKFDDNDWCNCHHNFALTIGVSEGKCIVYEDSNGNYNVAGTPINLAARVMGCADGDQIIFSEDAYMQLIDLVDDAHMDERFTKFSDVKFKHSLLLDVYQYLGTEDDYINSDVPQDLAMSEQRKRLELGMKKAGIPLPGNMGDLDRAKTVQMMEMLEQMVAQITGISDLHALSDSIDHAEKKI